nr:TSUP family transporter [Bacillus coahuilensis]
MIGNLQSGILAFIMLLILVYFLNKQKINSMKINKSSIVLLVGLVLGVLSAFLSIGGGPLNIAILSLLFGMRMEAAVIHSILIIFFLKVLL